MSHRTWLRAALLLLAGMVAPLLPWSPSGFGVGALLAAEPACSGEARITETFDNGATWDFCWQSRVRENLELTDVHYTPPGAAPIRVLASARLSQLHVAYDDSDVTYNDVTQYGLGSNYLLTLTPEDCPHGDLLTIQTRPALCRWRSRENSGYHTPSRAARAESLNLYTVSQVGAYAYVISWQFRDDGAMEPAVGATGALQRASDDIDSPHGRVLAGDPDTLWLSHTHNYYWRLDFDIGESATDDVFSEIHHDLLGDGRRYRREQVFDTEQARRIDPDSLQSWQIAASSDNDSPAWLLEPIRLGHRFERPDIEPYSEFDLFVTVANDCERFASQNARFYPDCLNHVLQYVDGESLLGADLVLWHRVGFHHVPRNEDQRNMHAHWDGFLLRPRNVLGGTSTLVDQPNAAPTFLSLDDRRNEPGEAIHAHLNVSDADNDVLTFSASGLPPGIRLSPRGHLQGSAERRGNYLVTITVRDDHHEVTAHFAWQIGQQRKGGGATGPGFCLFLMLGILGRRWCRQGRSRSYGYRTCSTE